MGRDLSGYMTTDAAMTNGKCRAECATRGYAFAGTQFGNYCFCGNSFGKTGPATCNWSCSVNIAEICGGIWANSVSVTGAVPAIPPVPTNGGRCVIDVKGQYGGQTGARGSYRDVEIQRWVVSSTPRVPGPIGALKAYKVDWDTTGFGERYDDDGVTRNAWTRGRASSVPNVLAGEPELTTRKIGSPGTWLVQMAPTSFPDGIHTTQQHTVVGSPIPPPALTKAPANAFGCRSIRATRLSSVSIS